VHVLDWRTVRYQVVARSALLRVPSSCEHGRQACLVDLPRSRRFSREGAEVVDEVCLIVEAVSDRHIRPVRGRWCPQRADDVLETQDAQESLRGQTNVNGKLAF